MKDKGEFGKLVVAGCLVERHKDEILIELPEIDAIVGTGAFDDILNVIRNITGLDVSEFDLEKQDIHIDISQSHDFKGFEANSFINKQGKAICFGDIHAPVSETKRIITTSPVWAYLKIAEGCDNNCAYCVIPSIRGRFRSRPIENIIQEAQDLVSAGIKELIVVAQDVTMYGLDLYKKHMLVSLLERLCGIEGLRWIRLHYLYPDELSDNLIDFISKHDKILKYLDIPIQHICDDILKKMNRRGTGEDIRNLLKKLRERIPGIVLRTSIITGLPGEGEKEFTQLFDFLNDARIERAGIFKYSPEEGSPAAEMSSCDSEVADKRAEILTELQATIMNEYDLTRVGDIETVLIEGRDEEGRYYGRSFAESPDVDGYIIVEGNDISAHEFIDVSITKATQGEVISVRVG
jgi:ribosomal protein S12 methylthiotransferase